MPTNITPQSRNYVTKGLVVGAPLPVSQPRPPTTRDKAPLGTNWLDTVAAVAYILVTYRNGDAIWVTAPTTGTTASSLVINPGNLTVQTGSIFVTAGNVTAAGTGTFGTLNATNSTISGNLGIGGTLTVTGVSTFNGNVVVAGDFDINSASTLTFQSSNAAANAIRLFASNAAGGITMDAGTNGYTISTATNGPFNVQNGTGTITLNGTGAQTINIGTQAAVIKTISLGGTGANVIAIGNTQTAGSVSIGAAMTTGTVNIGGTGLQTGTIAMGIGAGDQIISIGTGAANKAITMGNLLAAGTTTIRSGTGGMNLESPDNGDINIGANVTDKEINIGSIDGSSILRLRSGNGASSWVSDDGDILMFTGTGDLSLSDDDTNNNVLLGTGGGVKTVTIGSNFGASSTTIQSGTGGIDINNTGLVAMTTGNATAASPTATVAIAVNVGKATFTGFTTASTASQVFTVTNALITVTSPLLVTAHNEGANDAQMTVMRVKALAGSMEVTLKNNGAQALNGNVIITFWVVSN